MPFLRYALDYGSIPYVRERSAIQAIGVGAAIEQWSDRGSLRSGWEPTGCSANSLRSVRARRRVTRSSFATESVNRASGKDYVIKFFSAARRSWGAIEWQRNLWNVCAKFRGPLRRPLAKPLEYYSHRYTDRGKAMVRAYQTGVYSMQEIADYFGVHYSTVSRAARRLEAGTGSF